MKTVQVHDKEFKLYLTKEKIQEAVTAVAEKMIPDLQNKNPLFVIVLNGAYVFAADLIRHFEFDCEIAFIRLSSYQGMQSTRKVKEIMGLTQEVSGRNVVLIEDIIDTGTTMAYAKKKFKEKGAADVKLAAFLFKPNAFEEKYTIDYIGMEIPDDFIVGYGLDYDEGGRSYPDIYVVKPK